MAGEVRWYKKNIGVRLKPEIESVYRQWSGLEGDELISHLHAIRDRAWPTGRYPCIGEWIFLQQSISRFEQLPRIVSSMRRGAKLLDLGCCFGQDLRLLASAGAPTSNMTALDISDELWQIGYDLFRDRVKMQADFWQADIFDRARVNHLEGQFDFVVACQFFHLFSWKKQVEAMKTCVGFCKPGAVIMGYQRGQSKAQEVERDWGTMFIHDANSFSRIWEQVQLETKTQWKLQFDLMDLIEWGLESEDVEWMPPGCKFIRFVCQRE